MTTARISFTLRLGSEELEWLDALARNHGTTRSAVFRVLLDLGTKNRTVVETRLSNLSDLRRL